MAKIEMNLKEYEELVAYRRAFEDIMVPRASDYDVEYYQSHPEYGLDVNSRYFEDLHPETQELLKKYMFDYIPENLRGLGNIKAKCFRATLYKIFPTEEVESDETC